MQALVCVCATFEHDCVCVCVYSSVGVHVFTRVQLRVSVCSTEKLLDSLYITTLAEICLVDGSSDY